MSTISPPVAPFSPRTTLPGMKQPVVLIGLGEMGGVFARALLGSGYPVVPVLRSTPTVEAVASTPDPALVLVTVGEEDLPGVLDELPAPWRERVGLIQNELLPRDWIARGITHPTVAAVWFEKKPGKETKVIVPTPIAGPAADFLVESLSTIGLAARRIPDEQLTEELVTKNLYVLTTNIAGLAVGGGTVAELWNGHRDLARAVAGEVLAIQEALVDAPVDRERAMEGIQAAFAGDPDHGTLGRSAPRRLERALRIARDAGVPTPLLAEIGHDAGISV